MSERENDMPNEHQLWQSQNFLKRPEFVQNLIDITDIRANDLVVEIGPGRGIITQLLAPRVRQVIGVEIDNKLANSLRSAFTNTPNVKIVRANFLQWQLPSEPYKVFANIPFNMTADIVSKLTENRFPPEVAYLIMQDKAAERFTGRPLARMDTQTSILLKPWFEVEVTTRIDRREFAPVPKINAVLVVFRKRASSLVESQNRQWFRDFVVYGYNQWQPTILDAFRVVFSGRQRAIIVREIGIEGAKPTDLTIEQWLKLFETFMVHVPQSNKEIISSAEQKLKAQQRRLTKWHRTR